MNQKRAYRSPGEVNPTYLHAVDIDVQRRGKITGHRVVAGQVLRVCRGVGGPAGQYVFRYAEWNETLGEHLLYVERYGKRRCVREQDVRGVIGGE